jgi:hypothetical protein
MSQRDLKALREFVQPFGEADDLDALALFGRKGVERSAHFLDLLRDVARGVR